MATENRNASASTFNDLSSHEKNLEHSTEQRADSIDTLTETEKKKSSRLTLKQYLTVLSAFIVFLNTWGFLLSFGTFQTYYEQNLLVDKSSSDIAWISTTCAFISVAGGIVTGPLFDRGYLRPLMVVGSLLELFGIMMMSISSDYYQLFLSQGICVGVGMALIYVPSLAAVAAIFDNATRPKAIGIVASATGVGGLIYPIMFQRLLESIGFAWTVRSIGFFILGVDLLSFGVLFYKPTKITTVRPWIDVSALTNTPFLCAMLGGFFYANAYYLPLLYLPGFAQTSILQADQKQLAFYLISIINGVSAVGRLGAGQVAAWLGPVETTALSLATSSVVLLCWTAVHSTVGLIVWAVFWGLTSSVIVATLGAVVPVLSHDISLIGTHNGMYWAAVALGLFVGGPIGGALVQQTDKEPAWWHVQIFAGLFMLASATWYIHPVLYVRRKKQETTKSTCTTTTTTITTSPSSLPKS